MERRRKSIILKATARIYWPVYRMNSRLSSSVISAVAGFSCFFRRKTSWLIIRERRPTACSCAKRLVKKSMALWWCSKISTATAGICCRKRSESRGGKRFPALMHQLKNFPFSKFIPSVIKSCCPSTSPFGDRVSTTFGRCSAIRLDAA